MLCALLQFMSTVAVATLVHLVAMLASGRLAGLLPVEFVYGLGPQLLGLQIGPIRLGIRALLVGGFVRYAGSEDEPGPPGQMTLESCPLAIRAAVELSGCALLFAVGGFLLGLDRASRELWLGFAQVTRGVVSPSGAVEMCGDAIATLISATWTTSLGLVAVKMAAVNLLPLPPSNGGNALLAICAAALDIRRSTRRRVVVVGLCGIIGVWGAWLLALIRVVSG